MLWFYLALILEWMATAGFLAYIITRRKGFFRYGYGFLLAGFIAHTIFLGYRYHLLEAAPVLNFKAALGFFAWSIVLVYLIFEIRFRLKVLGSFVAPFAAFLMALSFTLTGVDEPVKPIFKSLWLPVHVVTVFAGNGLFTITFVASGMYLLQERFIKRKRLGALYTRLPSLATLDAIAHHALIYGFSFMTVGMITGSIYAQVALGSYWQWDPKEVWSLITWLLYAVLLHQRLTVGWRGRRAAIMAMVCFAMLIFTFAGASFWLGGYHSFENLGARNGL
ncbi:c-type cytochrome biogenesis protein CcsB [Desulfatiglans anilini]|uniref:c-type cytochrome biogenesis protein CcsB n=1 Tax=Desulfatiglans anilini TaxID=90728 RepID=UPI0004065A10|nr:c-type cytochrome biogenesis protein CcsB [Desulfatiglans anilini]